MTLSDHANEIAETSAPKVGLGFLAIAAIVLKLLPALAECASALSGEEAQASAKAKLARRWNERKQRYRGRLVEHHRLDTLVAAQSQGHVITELQADQITQDTFDHIRLQDESEVETGYKVALAGVRE